MRLIISKVLSDFKELGSRGRTEGLAQPGWLRFSRSSLTSLLAPTMGLGGSLPLISICSSWQPQRGKDGAQRWDDGSGCASGDGGDAAWNDRPKFIFVPECVFFTAMFLPGCSPDRCGSSSLGVWASPRGSPAYLSYKTWWWFVGSLYLMVLPTGCRPQLWHYMHAGADTYMVDISLSLITWRLPQQNHGARQNQN